LNHLITNLSEINSLAMERQRENEQFRSFLKNQDSLDIDKKVHALNEKISAAINCTDCGNCCRSFMINVTAEEMQKVATSTRADIEDFKKKYIEESPGGIMVMNTIPCAFLSENKCTIYENRFNECHEFPHLDKPHVTNRLFGLLQYYAVSPIIFNVIEALKAETHFDVSA
jgi:Fe-S-cluster containining protein